MHRLEDIPPDTKKAARDCLYVVLSHWSQNNQYGPFTISHLFSMTADSLIECKIIDRPEFLGGKNAGGQTFTEYFSQIEPGEFPNYGISEDIVLLIRLIIWELYIHGIISPSVNERSSTAINDRNTWVYFDMFNITPYGASIFSTTNTRIQVFDTDGYLKKITTADPPPDEEMMRYLRESISVFYTGHLLASVILLAIASERLIDITANNLRVALGDPDGPSWYQRKYHKKDISERFSALEAKLLDTYSRKLSDEKIKDSFQSVVGLVFETIRVARNDIAHPSGREFTWDEVSGYLYHFVQYFRYLNKINKIIIENPKN